MFKYIVLASAFFIAMWAAFFSVTGIAQLFSGHMVFVALAAVSIEIGKIVTVSLLYRYRSPMHHVLRWSLSVMLVVLMGLTSFGIYAYLASSYASSASGIKGKENMVSLYTDQKSNIDADITRLSQRSSQLQIARTQQENRIDSLIAKGRSITGQQSIIKSQDAEIVDIQKQIRVLASTRDSIATQIVSTSNSMSTEGKIGTFHDAAQSLGMPLDTVVKWFIIFFMFVFDPLSVCLFFGYNVIVKSENESIGENARTRKNRATSPPAETEPLEESETYNEPEIGEDALSTIDPLANPENNIVQLDQTPYYMNSDYDWKHDTRWHTDPSAKMYLSLLGMAPNA
jgi:hypothetical protein